MPGIFILTNIFIEDYHIIINEYAYDIIENRKEGALNEQIDKYIQAYVWWDKTEDDNAP